MVKKPGGKAKTVAALTHGAARRANIPTAEMDPVMAEGDKAPVHLAYERRNRDLDPQLVWRGKDEQDAADLVVQAPPLYIQEKLHPKALIDDLMRHSGERRQGEAAPDLFADFNGLPEGAARTEFYRHDANWSNRMILGDALQAMASLAEREGLRGKVQAIYIDPPYGIRFNSNFQWSTTSRDVKDGRAGHITREPEQVKAFRDTWRDGIHSYLGYLRDRLTVARDLLAESGSVFVQIGDENVHRVRAVMDEVFGEENFVNQINCRTNSGTTRGDSLKRTNDYLLWYAKNTEAKKFRRLLVERDIEPSMYNQLLLENLSTRSMTREEKKNPALIPDNAKPYTKLPIHSMNTGDHEPREAFGKLWTIPSNRSWRHSLSGFESLLRSSRIEADRNALRSRYFHSDYIASEITETWTDTAPEMNKSYVVQTSERIVERCLLMTTDPGDLVLDPTCGSGTTAYVAEQWGRRWITIDTSRVALALARARVMGARYPFYLLADSPEGQQKEAELTRRAPSETPTAGDLRQGFVYERVPHVTLRAIANNAEIDTIWETWQQTLEPLRQQLNAALGRDWQEWRLPRQAGDDWPDEAKAAHAAWWQARIARQKEIDASIAAKADSEYLYDKPYRDKHRIRVAGPFTVESLSPHRIVADEGDSTAETGPGYRTSGPSSERDFAAIVLAHLQTAGVQQAHKEDKIDMSSIEGWPGHYVCASGHFRQGEAERRAGIMIGPEFGTVQKPDLVAAAREAAEAGFDALIACAFSYDAHSSEFERLGRVPVLKARMNADLHMAGELKNTGKGNLFVIFGEPDIDILEMDDGNIQVQIAGIDIYRPETGEIHSDGPDGIAMWFVDSDYNEESFFVRQAYFLGAGDPYKALKTTLKAEIDPEAWATLHSDTSRPFPRPKSGRIAIKVINHLGDEAMKVFRV